MTRTRFILGALTILVLLICVACGSAASPSPSPSAAKPSTDAAASSKPAQSAPAASQAAAGPDLKAEWDKTLAAAKKEGKVTVVGSSGDAYRSAAMEFQKAYPEITLEYSGMKGSDFAPKILAERSGGQYLWDVHTGGAQTSLLTLRPNGVLDPVKPSLLAPEVLDSSKWLGGIDNAWMDKDKNTVFGFEAGLQYAIFINREKVPESELISIDQLIDPKWKGKIVSNDLRTAGSHNGVSAWLLKNKGEEWLRKFYSQDIVITKDERMEVEGLLRGTYPIMIAINPAVFETYNKEGLLKNVKPLDPNNPHAVALSTGSSHVVSINKAPHPNAAKVYMNWLLSPAGQQAYVNATNTVSRRLDVKGGNPDMTPKPNVKYGDLNTEEMMGPSQQAMNIAKEIFK